MSSDFTAHLRDVRRLIGDRSKGDPVTTDPFLEELTRAAIDELSDEMGTGQIRTLAFVALSAGQATKTVTLPSSLPAMLHLQNLVNASNGYQLDKRPLDFILDLRVGTNTPRGQPLFYALREDNAQALTIELHPAPVEATDLDAYWEPVHRDVDPVGYATFGFSKLGKTALRLRVAGRAILALAPEALAKLNPPKSPAFAKDLLEQSARIASMEFARLHPSDTADYVERTR